MKSGQGSGRFLQVAAAYELLNESVRDEMQVLGDLRTLHQQQAPLRSLRAWALRFLSVFLELSKDVQVRFRVCPHQTFRRAAISGKALHIARNLEQRRVWSIVLVGLARCGRRTGAQ